MRQAIASAFLRSLYLSLICFSSASAGETQEQSDLLGLAKSLQCAASSEQADSLLDDFRGISIDSLGLPNEWFNSSIAPSIHAASLDITLQTLVSTQKRFPELATEVEDVILQWNYCEVFLDNVFYDFVSVDGELKQQYAGVTSPIDWQGFHALGFLGEHSDRLSLKSYQPDDIPLEYRKLIYSQLFRKQCLPHPQTSKMFYDVNTYFPWRIKHGSYDRTKFYPYEWSPSCAAEAETLPEPIPAQHAAVVEGEVELASAEVLTNQTTEQSSNIEQPNTDDDKNTAKPKRVKSRTKTKWAKDTKKPEQAKALAESDQLEPDGIARKARDKAIPELPKVLTVAELTTDKIEPLQAKYKNVAELTTDIVAPVKADVKPIAELTTDKVVPVKAKLRPIAELTTDKVVPVKARLRPIAELTTDKVVPVLISVKLVTEQVNVNDKQLTVPYRAPPSAAEKELLMARLLLGYRYELALKQESQAASVSGPGYYYYSVPLRPESLADGVPDYVNPNDEKLGLTESALVAAIANSETEESGNALTDAKGPVVDNTAAGRSWVDNFLDRNPQTPDTAEKTKRPVGRRPKLKKVQPVVPTVTALTTLPVVVENNGKEGPTVVIEAIPEPETDTIPDPIRTKPRKKYYGLSGFITAGNRSFDSDGFSITTGASYKPIKDSYWFARGSWNYRVRDGEFVYNWGVGYDDWHPGTFSVQLNHWGPLLPGDYLDIENAIASASYKFKKNSFMTKRGLSSSFTLSQKLSGDPIASWSNSWNPKGKWFFRTTLSQPIKGGDTSWAYGFGYANYSPFTFSFEYNNWGYNKAFEDNFKDNGILSLTWRWRY